MPVESYKVYTYKCDALGCGVERVVEDKGGSTGRQPKEIFTGTILYESEKGFIRVHWVACKYGHILGAVQRTVKESLGHNVEA